MITSTTRRQIVIGSSWAVAIVVTIARIAVRTSDQMQLGEPWQSGSGHLLDFRDLITVPGSYLLAGGNPYDSAAYLAAYPWAQGFNPYAPGWLLLSVAFAPLPYALGAVVYQLIVAGCAILLLRVALGWVAPRAVALGVPVGLLWLNVWPAGRFALEGGSSLIVALGVVVALRGVWMASRVPAASPYRPGIAALGLALALLKPQFGLILLVALLAARRWDVVWRGVLGLTVTSAPVVVACSVASGGFGAFVRSVLDNVTYSSSPDAPTGLASPYNVRIDPVGVAARYGLIDPPTWLAVAVPVLCVLAAAWVAGRRSGSMIALCAGVSGAMLLAVAHQPYDLIVMVLPLLVGVGWLVQRATVSPIEWITWAAAGLTVLHVHRVSTTLIPGLDLLGADTIDSTLLVIALCGSVLLAARASRPVVSPATGVQQ